MIKTITDTYSKNYMKHDNACMKHTERTDVKASGRYSNHCALRVTEKITITCKTTVVNMTATHLQSILHRLLYIFCLQEAHYKFLYQ